MMKRWLYHYEIKHAIIRLLTLIVVTWCMSGIISSSLDPSEPIKIQMTICFVLLLLNFCKLTFASSPKYSQKLEDVLPTTQRFNLKSTAVKILLLPLLAVMGLSAFVLSGQIHRFQYNSFILMDHQQHFQLDSTISPSGTEDVTMLVLIMSSWTSQGAEKRQILRDSTLHWAKSKEAGTNINYRFILGQPPSDRMQSWMGPKLIDESEKYHDLLIVPAPDLHNSEKLYESLKWASSSVKFDYLLKTEDDVFVRWDTIRKELATLGQKDNYWNGFVYR